MPKFFDCRFCGDEMPLTIEADSGERSKRSDADFCSDDCRTQYHNMRRKQQRKAKRMVDAICELEMLGREYGTHEDELQLIGYLRGYANRLEEIKAERDARENAEQHGQMGFWR